MQKCSEWPHAPRGPWVRGFPDVIAQANYREMVSHPAYRDAKGGVSSDAALSVVSDCISDDAVEMLLKVIGDAKPLVLGVHAEESIGRNKIPVAYAEVLAEILRLQTDPGIVQASVANHTNAPTIYHRFASPPLFDGHVHAGAEYLLVDDTCTAGGTLTNLKGFVESNGGKVLAISVLSLTHPSRKCEIGLDTVTFKRLKMRHPALDRYWQESFGYGTECLTEGEAGHLLRAPSVDWIRDRLTEARRDLDLQRDQAATGS
jgi:hypothetical protein